MASVILCSELGRGFGHLAKLADYAVELEAQGYSVKLVCSDLHDAHQIPEFFDIAIFQAPVFREASLELGVDDVDYLNYSTILRRNGYRDIHTLAPLLRGWLHIQATLNADIVVADHAPTAILAAKLLKIPSIITGSGYCVPPLTTPLKSVQPWRDVPEAELTIEDQALLRVVNDTVVELGFGDVRLKNAKELFEESAQWIFSIPEMDHYGARDQPYVVRWTNSTPRLSPVWPRAQGDKILVNLHADSLYLHALLEQLQLSNLPVLAVIPEVSNGMMERYHNTNINLQREMVDLKQAVDQCNVFINDADHDIVYELMSYGVPSIFLPSRADQIMLAYQLSQQGYSFVGPATAEELNLLALLKMSKDQDQVWLNCSHLSMKYENHKSLNRLHDLVKAELLA
jgi:hypothetical protein